MHDMTESGGGVRRKNAVVMITDRGYLPAALFVAGQLVSQPARNFDIIILAIACTDTERTPPDPAIEIIDFKVDARAAAAKAIAGKSAAFGRLSLDAVLDAAYEKILYLDADVWIGRRPLNALFDMDLGNMPLAAVSDAAEVVRRGSADWQAYRRGLGLSADAKYFNSGMLLINRPVYARDQISERTLSYLASGAYRGNYNDQCALNAVINGNFVELSPVWNWMYATRWRLTRDANPGVIHFIGPNKPWRDRKARHDPVYRAAMRRSLAELGYEEFVADVPAPRAALRRIGNSVKDATAALGLDRRDAMIRAYLRKFA